MREDSQLEADVDYIVGRYTYITAPVWGRCKVSMSTVVRASRRFCSYIPRDQTLDNITVS